MTTDVQQIEQNNTETTPITPAEDPSYSKHKVKVNGKELEVTLDDLKRSYGLDKASHQRFNEAVEKLKEAENIKKMLSSKNIEILKNNGWTDEEIEEQAAEYLIKLSKDKSLTPEQRAQKERDEEYLRLKKEKEDREKYEKDNIKRLNEEKEAKEYQTEFLIGVEKADKQTWLDLKDPIIMSHIVHDVSTSIRDYKYDMPVLEAVRRLEQKMEKKDTFKKDYLRKMIKKSINDIDDSELDAFLERGVKGIKEKSVEAIKKAEAPFDLRSTKSNEPLKNTPKHDAAYYRKMRYSGLT